MKMGGKDEKIVKFNNTITKDAVKNDMENSHQMNVIVGAQPKLEPPVH